jgi:catechol 2,3-dioxygenase-like lactoylglutathione lyase family enzyme
MSKVLVRYIVDDVDKAISFYTNFLKFDVVMHPAPAFAILSLADLQLLLSSPSEHGGGGKIMQDGTKPEPGGWNRFQIAVDNLSEEVDRLKKEGAKFRNEIVEGVAGKQILIEDPSGNPIELFEYYKK